VTATEEHLAGSAGPGDLASQPAGTAAWRADQHATTAHSVSCPCQAPPGRPYTTAGDHLARYLRAEQSGAIARQSLTEVIASFDVIALHVLIQSPQQQSADLAGGQTADRVTCAQLDGGLTPDRIEASDESVLGGPLARHPTSAPDAFFRGYDDVAATCTREARELEAGE
jgi:hypothetical protein